MLASDSIAISTGASHEDTSASSSRGSTSPIGRSSALGSVAAYLGVGSMKLCESVTWSSKLYVLTPASRRSIRLEFGVIEAPQFVTYATYKLLTDQPLFNGLCISASSESY